MNKLRILFVALVVLSLNSFAQKGLKWGVGLSFIPDNLMTIKMPGSGFNGPTDESQNIKYVGRFHGGVLYGVNLKYNFNQNLSVESGYSLGFRMASIRFKNTETGEFNPDISHTKTVGFNELPLKLNYSWELKKYPNLKSYVGLGASFTLTELYDGVWVMDLPVGQGNELEYYQMDILRSTTFSFGIEKSHKKNRGKSYWGVTFSYNNNKQMYSEAFGTFNGNIEEYSAFSYLSLDYKYYLPWVRKLKICIDECDENPNTGKK